MSEFDNLPENPLLSVIIPVYNVEDYLREALDSIRKQSFQNIEIIAINDGSTDSSGKILEQYQSMDDRFRVYHQENAGLSATRNRGLSKAEGNIIYFFDSDDVVVERMFEKVITRMQISNSQLTFFGLTFIDNVGNESRMNRPKKRPEIENPITGKDFLRQLINSKKYGAIVQKYFIRKSFLLANDLSFEKGYLHEDESFTLEALCLADRITSFSEVMLKKRVRNNSIMRTKKGIKNVEGWAKAIERVLEFLDKNNIDFKTREVVFIRLRKVAHTAIRTHNNLQTGITLHHYLPKRTQHELGFLVYAHAMSPFLYRILKFINRKLGY